MVQLEGGKRYLRSNSDRFNERAPAHPRDCQQFCVGISRFPLYRLLFPASAKSIRKAFIMSTRFPITVARGDGIGPEIMDATLRILNAAKAPLDYEQIDIGEKVYLAGN